MEDKFNMAGVESCLILPVLKQTELFQYPSVDLHSSKIMYINFIHYKVYRRTVVKLFESPSLLLLFII